MLVDARPGFPHGVDGRVEVLRIGRVKAIQPDAVTPNP